MNIVFITKDYLPKIGGVEIHVSMLAAELVKDKHNINIITLANPGERELSGAEDKSSSVPCHPELVSGSASIKVLRLSSNFFSDCNAVKPGPVALSRTHSCLSRTHSCHPELVSGSASKLVNVVRRISHYKGLLTKMILFSKADVIHFHDFSIMYYFLPFVYIFKTMLKKRIYITFHGWEGIFPPPPDIIKKRALCESLAAGNICIGDFIPKWYGTRADIISYGGVEKKDVSDVSNNSSDKNIVFVGRLSADTGIVQYLEAWKKIQRKYTDLNLIICGDGPLMGNISSEINDGKLFNVTLAGMVRNIDDYLRTAEVVFTSGYLSMLTAFAYGKKVISVYDNDLKKDYLEMMPDSIDIKPRRGDISKYQIPNTKYQRDMFWIAGSAEEILYAYDAAVNDKDKAAKAYKFALDNDWAKVKEEYYKLWKI